MPGKIVVHGARVHNLKNLHLEIPRDQLVVITGVSGSGKSSLAFDTLYAEGQRRYVESLSTYTRHFLRQVEKPDVDSMDGLSPAIAIRQTHGHSNPRSTLGTITDIYDFLRLLFARVGRPFCYQCGREISAQAVEQISDQLFSLAPGARIFVLAPVVAGRKGDFGRELNDLAKEGFSRVRIDGRVHELSETIRLSEDQAHRIDLIVDRLILRDGVERRLADSLEVASRFGRQIIKVEIHSVDGSIPSREMTFSQKFACVRCGVSLPEISPRLFSFNSPVGACPACEGLRFKPVSRRNHKDPERNMERNPCSPCGGTGLRREGLAVKIGEMNIAELASLPVTDTLDFFDHLKLGDRETAVGRRVVGEIVDRLQFLTRVGLGYLSLDRSWTTLSGGEAQRARLATQIGSNLAGVMYILDEPSVGLHQKDNARLLALLKQLRDAGNSVIVVEHDREFILAADYVIDLGPGAGVNGGEVVAQGTPGEIMVHERSLTGRYLSGRLQIPIPAERRRGTGKVLVVRGAKQNNLKNLTVKFPIGAMTCVTGVSGSGKSSLVVETLYGAIARRLGEFDGTVGLSDEISGWQHIDRVISVDQAPIGRTPKSNPATYVGLYNPIRDLFAQLPEARVRGYKPARFSFNAGGGRCEACGGEGITKVEMYFLPEVFVACDICDGKRYNRETLEVKYKGLSIADILDLTVNQALEILGNFPAISAKLGTLRDVGLGYLRLGQPAPTLSGGEAQRIKLARELSKRSTGKSLYVFDEPTTGLHYDDVGKLLEVLNRLIDLGNTMIIIEHNLDVIKAADYVIDLGPDGGERGGNLIAEGTPEEISSVDESYTGQYLRNCF